MQTTRLVTLIAFCAVLFCAPNAVFGATFTFNGNASDTWDDRFNWTPDTGPPVAGDTAVIPSGKTCIVKVNDQAAKIIEVAGTLGIEGKSLVIGDTPTTSTTSTLDGTLYFKKVGSVVGQLEIEGTVTMNGGTDGLITAKADHGREGRIRPRISSPLNHLRTLVLTANITITGTIKILSGLELNGTAVVDDADDVMTLGETGGYVLGGSVVKGSGAFKVSAGLLQVNLFFFNTTPQPTWKLSGGEIDVFIAAVSHKFPITMTGGTLDMNDTFRTTAECKFSGGTIKVADGKVAEFIRP